MTTRTNASMEFPDYQDPRDIDEAVDRGIEVDGLFTRVSPGHYEAEVTLDAADAERLNIVPSVVLTVTPATLALTYLRTDGSEGDIASEPAEEERQALAYRYALRHPESHALELAESACERDEEAAAEAA